MADANSTVQAAEQAMWGPTAEAQALIDLYRTTQCDSSVSILAISILERFVSAWEILSTELLRHGRLPLSPLVEPQAPASGDVEL